MNIDKKEIKNEESESVKHYTIKCDTVYTSELS